MENRIKELIKTEKNIKFGDGGSENIILLDKRGKCIFKIVPTFAKFHACDAENHDQYEYKFYKLFKNLRLPTIVDFYDYAIGKDIGKLLPKVKSVDEILLKKLSDTQYKLHEAGLKYHIKHLKSKYQIICLEFCPTNINEAIKKSRNKIKLIERIIFHIIFTLAVLQKKYNGFIHNDFFLRNILGAYVDKHEKNDYIEYCFGKEKFYLEANGFYPKINDFGYSVVPGKIESNIVDDIKKNNNNRLGNRMILNDPKADIFNFLHDIYCGADLGAASLCREIKNFKPIEKFLGKFIDVATIKKINKIHKKELDWVWSVKNSAILSKTVKIPKEYLTDEYFKDFHQSQIDIKKINIIKIYKF